MKLNRILKRPRYEGSKTLVWRRMAKCESYRKTLRTETVR